MQVWFDVAAFGAAVGALSGAVVPRVLVRVPDPEPDPTENPEDYPEHVPFAELGRRPRLAVGCGIAGAVAGGALGLVLGWSWGLTWLLLLVPFGCLLAVIDFVTWYLPARIVWTGCAVVLACEALAAIVLADPHVISDAALGATGIGALYAVLWIIAPRGLAFGDVRLGVLVGLAAGPFGLSTVFLAMFLGFFSQVVSYLPLRLLSRTIKGHVPFGPFQFVGLLGAVVLGQVLIAAS